MRNFFFPKLAVQNIKKNAKVIFPFMLTSIITVAMFYIITALAFNPSVIEYSRSAAIMLELTHQVTAIFAVIFLFYTNSFLMKRRKMEFGLYNVLGMDKKHIARTILWETALIAIVSFAFGVGSGILLDKLMYLSLMKLVSGEVSLGFVVSGSGIVKTLILFGVVFVLILIDSLRQIYFAKPVELLRGGQVGEKEPKAKWITALLGAVSLGAGYWIAITVKNPVAAVNNFLLAVLLVIIGTYLLFTAGSIALLKLMRKNKRYYYQTKHFISVSGMMYRMKQNAVGLGNICILSTAVLVMVSTTLSLHFGIEDAIRTRYPQTITIEMTSDIDRTDELHTITGEVLRDKNLSVEIETEVSYTWFGFAVLERDGIFNTNDSGMKITDIEDYRSLIILALEDYNRSVAEPFELDEGEVLLYSNRIAFPQDRFSLFGEQFTVRERIRSIPGGDFMVANITASHYIIVKDRAVLDRLCEAQTAAYGDKANAMHYRYAFDLDDGIETETIVEVSSLLQKRLAEQSLNGSVACREIERNEFIAVYGGLFFIGIFLGALFIMATVLIIYYKQISEGYGDKARFTIMKNVGLDRKEIKKTIRAQILTVFFLPLAAAGVHIAAAFPALTRLMEMLYLRNVLLFGVSTAVCFLVFAVFYTVVYNLTARTYYKIVG